MKILTQQTLSRMLRTPRRTDTRYAVALVPAVNDCIADEAFPITAWTTSLRRAALVDLPLQKSRHIYPAFDVDLIAKDPEARYWRFLTDAENDQVPRSDLTT